MEGEEQKWEQEEVEEEEETTLLLARKSRTETEVGINVSFENSGHEIQPENGAENGKSTVEDEQKLENFDGILEEENEKEKSENCVYYDKDEGIWKCRICYWTYQSGSFCVDDIQNHNGHLHKLMNDKILNKFNCETEGVEFTPNYSGEQQINRSPGHNILDILSKKIVAQNNFTSTLNSQHEGDLEDNISLISSLRSSEISSEDFSKNNVPPKEIVSAEIDPAIGDELELTELEVESVIQKQTTHELYCPNCNSCITGRVILRKRKRYNRDSNDEGESEANSKVVTGIVQETQDHVHITDDIGVGGIPTLIREDNDRDRDPEVFRCLSCFSFFIPTRNGFKLFGRLGEKNVKENVQDAQVPSTKKSWFASIFALVKQETSAEQGSRLGQEVGKVDNNSTSNLGDQSGQSSSLEKASTHGRVSEELAGTIETNNSVECNAKIVSSPRQGPSKKSMGVIGAGDNAMLQKTGVDSTLEHLEAYTNDQLKESKLTKEVLPDHERDLAVTRIPNETQATDGEYVENDTLFSPDGGLKLLISSTKESVTAEKTENSQMPNPTTENRSAVVTESETDSKMNESVDTPREYGQHIGAAFLTGSVVETKNTNFTSENGGAYHTEVSQHTVTTTKLEVLMGESHKVNSTSLVKDSPVIQGRPVDIARDIEQVAAEKDAGLHKDTVLTIDVPPVEATASQSTRDIILSAETQSALHSGTQICAVDRETETRKAYEIEVIKSIVYGGLAESITSLSIVSSAAGGDTATLNVIALGLANLIGGLFIIIHNIWDLKSHSVEQVSNQITEHGDRYREVLGRRENFVLHAAVALLSYFIFGLVPPMIYGFSFRKSDDTELKLLAVAAASLICIVMLAIGKVRCQSQPQKSYLKTIARYFILGFMVSGASFAVGVLMKRLLEKLGLLQSTSSVANLLQPETTPKHSAWASD